MTVITHEKLTIVIRKELLLHDSWQRIDVNDTSNIHSIMATYAMLQFVALVGFIL